MAHFAEVDSKTNIVLRVVVIPDSQEYNGQEYCKKLYNSQNKWLKTSYNTVYNSHLRNGKPIRKNYASPGYFYNEKLDAFIPPKKFDSWILDEVLGMWHSPVPFPGNLPDGTYNKSIRWNENIRDWVILDDPNPETIPEGYTAVFDEYKCCWDIIPIKT